MSETNDTTATFRLDGDDILRDGKKVAQISGDHLKVMPKCAQYRTEIEEWMRSEGMVDDGPEPAAPAEPSTPAPKKRETEAEAQSRRVKALAAEAEVEKRKASNDWADDVTFARRTGIPSPPKKHPMKGDKDPKYVEWLNKYRPDKFAKKYGVIGPGQKPVFEIDENGIEQFKGFKDCTMATRKTVLTEKPEGAGRIADDQDWGDDADPEPKTAITL